MKTTKFCVVSIRRPDGRIETVRHPKVREMTPRLWKQMQAAMAKTGKGEPLTYVNKVEQVPLTLEEQRRELVYELQAALDRREAALRRAHAGGVGHVQAANEVVKRAEEALEAFDAAHPEIIKAIRATRKAAAGRAMWD